MLLLYTRLRWRDHKPSSPQKNCLNLNQKTAEFDRSNQSKKAHQSMTDQLRQVESNYALNRRFFL
jgi:hypothetical protein